MKQIKIAILVLALFTTQLANACNNASLYGSYRTGYRYVGAATALGVGYYHFDGAANITIYGSNILYGTVSYSGTENGITVTGGGIYNVDSSCKLNILGHQYAPVGTRSYILSMDMLSFINGTSTRAFGTMSGLIGSTAFNFTTNISH